MYSTYASYKAKKQASGTFKRVYARKQAASTSILGRSYVAVRRPLLNSNSSMSSHLSLWSASYLFSSREGCCSPPIPGWALSTLRLE